MIQVPQQDKGDSSPGNQAGGDAFIEKNAGIAFNLTKREGLCER
jgi:hypothetical protein